MYTQVWGPLLNITSQLLFFFDRGYGYWHDTVILVSTLLSSGENIFSSGFKSEQIHSKKEEKKKLHQADCRSRAFLHVTFFKCFL